ncbi:putative protease YdcP precursor [Oxobacter pfennigii]|uniref:Putative protease YdcP n=1 Tax=Oxobacter pfennigii TaxID=36849 RepID=A0A0N8NTI7_9CLOT|nr:U32 family peptidase [Oxobacter pfennigii]KPU44944.1 putative protease YdcP precursor [Oxobacter pfennigii]
MNKIELLAPAGNMEKLKVAFNYGADAVYIGGPSYGLRAFAGNFSNDELKEAVLYAHKLNKKIYVTVNIFPHNEDLKGMDEYLKYLYDLGTDAIIISDPGVFSIAKEAAPKMEIHLSTQANNVNYRSAIFWHGLGVKRIVLARELSLEEIKEVRDKTPSTLDLEAFVHGAMCISYSGRCLLSNYMTGRDSNRGECAHPCRYKYYLMEEKRPGNYMPVEEDERGTYIMNSKDLCMIEYLPDIINAGITSLKIEGRMKSSFYVATVVKAYRKALDEFLNKGSDYKFNPEWLKDLTKASHREFSSGFYHNDPGQIYENSSYIRDYDIVGLVLDYDKNSKTAYIEQRNRVYKGERVEVFGPNFDTFELELDCLRNADGESIDVAPHPQMKYSIKCDRELKPFDMLIKQKPE